MTPSEFNQSIAQALADAGLDAVVTESRVELPDRPQHYGLALRCNGRRFAFTSREPITAFDAREIARRVVSQMQVKTAA